VQALELLGEFVARRKWLGGGVFRVGLGWCLGLVVALIKSNHFDVIIRALSVHWIRSVVVN
jgi:hypothetical protein